MASLHNIVAFLYWIQRVGEVGVQHAILLRHRRIVLENLAIDCQSYLCRKYDKVSQVIEAYHSWHHVAQC